MKQKGISDNIFNWYVTVSDGKCKTPRFPVYARIIHRRYSFIYPSVIEGLCDVTKAGKVQLTFNSQQPGRSKSSSNTYIINGAVTQLTVSEIYP